VQGKFGLLAGEGQQWLRVRLGKAITQRRRFLRYTRDHRKKLGINPTDLWRPEIQMPLRPQELGLDQGVTFPTMVSQSLKPSSAEAPTTASNLRLSNLQLADEDLTMTDLRHRLLFPWDKLMMNGNLDFHNFQMSLKARIHLNAHSVGQSKKIPGGDMLSWTFGPTSALSNSAI
jgi:hypothetical protein